MSIDQALRIARRYGKRYADGGDVSRLVFDPTPMNSPAAKTPNRRVMEGHQEYEQGYGPAGSMPWEAPRWRKGINSRGQDVDIIKAAEGGNMTLQRTQPYPDAPEGYEFYGPSDAPVPEGTVGGTPQPTPAPEQPPPAANEFDLQRQQAEALPDRPPALMEPDLSATQMREQEIPEGYARNDAGEVFNKETGETLKETPRTNVSPFTRTPEGQYQWNFPKIADILGNLGGGWSAPSGGTALGAGMRIPRNPIPPEVLGMREAAQTYANSLMRAYGDDHASIAAVLDSYRANGSRPEFLEEIFNRLPPEIRSRIKIDDAMSPPSGALNLDTFFKHAEPFEVEHMTTNDLRTIQRQLQESSEPKRYQDQNPKLWDALHERLDVLDSGPVKHGPEPTQHDYTSLDELERAVGRRFEQVPYEPHQNKPIAEGQRLSISEFFGNHGPEDVDRLTDTQIRHLWGDILNEQANDSGTWHNISNYQPELVDELRSSIRQRRETAAPAQGHRPDQEMQGILDAISEALSAPPGVKTRQITLPRRNETYGPLDSPYAQTVRRERQAFTEAYNQHIAPHFPDQNDFLKSYFAGLAGQGTSIQWVPHRGFDISTEITNKEGRTIGSMTRDFDPRNKTAHHAYFRLNTGERENGVTPTILKNQIEVYKKLGIERVMLNANIDVGSYAWAKYGWTPTAGGWASLAGDIKFQLANHRWTVSPLVKKQVEEILNNPNPKAIWLLADLTVPVAGSNSQTVKIGKEMLLNRSWNGTLNLNDEESMQRFKSYVSARSKGGSDKDK